MQLTEKLYWYPWQGRANNCNSYLLKGHKTILFDPGHIYNEFNESCLEMLTRQMSSDGLSFGDVDYLLCTHGHPDHVESAGLIRKENNLRFGIHSGDNFILEALAQHYASRSGRELPSLKPDFDVAEGTLRLGDDSENHDLIEVMHTPGHSPGCVCYYLPEHKALVSGDTVFSGSIGRADLPGGDMDTLGQSIEKLSRIEDLEWLLPGHMGYLSGAAVVKRNFEQINNFFFS